MATILVTNDDGVFSPGLLALKRALGRVGDVVVLAPERNWSATSHAKTMHKPLRLRQVALADGSAAHCSSGSPTDCVALAAAGVLEVQPELVVSGINAGHNLGVDITYSGTVACAMEATIKGIPGIAVSTARPDELAESDPRADGAGAGERRVDEAALLAHVAELVAELAQRVLVQGLPPRTLLNVNVPGLPPAQLHGLRVTRMGSRHYPAGELVQRDDPYGRPYYWLGGGRPIDDPDAETDVGAVANGYVSVTPISLDLTDHAFLAELRTWDLAALPDAVRAARPSG